MGEYVNKYAGYHGKKASQIRTFSKDKPWYESLDPIYLTKLCDGENRIIRFATDFYSFGQHNVFTDPTDMRRDYKTRKGKMFSFWCPDFDPSEETFGLEGDSCCPICRTFAKKGLLGRGRITIFAQGYEYECLKSGKKRWSELRTYVLSSSLMTEIQNVLETTGNGMECNDPKNGYALYIKYNTESKGVPTWSAQKGDDIPLEDIPTYNEDDFADIVGMFRPNEPSEIEESLKSKGYYKYLDGSADDDDEEDEDEAPSKSKRTVRSSNSFEDDDDEDEKPSKSKHREEDEDEDERPAKTKSKRSFDDDDEDEKPAKTKSKRSFDDDDEDEKPSKSKHREEDEDEDEKPAKSKSKHSFDDDDEDEKPAKSKSKHSFDDDDEDEKPAKSKHREEDDEDEKPAKTKPKRSFDDDDEPAEDEVAARAEKAPAKKAEKKTFVWDED